MAAKSLDWQPGPTVCRCCLTEGCYKDISTEYFWMGKREVYAEMLSETFDVTVSYAKTSVMNSNSRLICEPCISRLRDATDFKRQVLDCERTFHQYLSPQKSLAMEDSEQDQEKEYKVSTVKVEVAFSDDDMDTAAPFHDDDDDDLDDEPLTKLATKIPKRESVDYQDLEDNAKAVKRKSTSKDKPSPAKKAKRKELVKSTVKPSASKSTPAPKPEKKKKGYQIGETEVRKMKLKRSFDDWRHNVRIIFNNTNVLPFKCRAGKFMCAFCRELFPHIDELKAHATEHKQNEKEIEKIMLETTADKRWKVEITDMQCKICCAPLEDIERARKHLADIHKECFHEDHDNGAIPYKIEGNNFVCANCEEQFPLFSNLVIHMNEHYPGSACSECGKAFSNIWLLKQHISNRHSNVKLNKKTKPNLKKCQYCNEICAGFYGKMKHFREAHGIGYKYTCDLCPTTFATITMKQKHFKRVHMRELNFSCDKCSYKCFDGHSLKNHMISHDSGDKVLKCDICDKGFSRRKSLAVHMIIHDKDKWFACELCDYRCPKRWNLRTHKKTRHPEIDLK